MTTEALPDVLLEARTEMYALISERVANGAVGDWLAFEADVNLVFDQLALRATEPAPSAEGLDVVFDPTIFGIGPKCLNRDHPAMLHRHSDTRDDGGDTVTTEALSAALERRLAERPDVGPFDPDNDNWIMNVGEFVLQHQEEILRVLRAAEAPPSAEEKVWVRGWRGSGFYVEPTIHDADDVTAAYLQGKHDGAAAPPAAEGLDLGPSEAELAAELDAALDADLILRNFREYRYLVGRTIHNLGGYKGLADDLGPLGDSIEAALLPSDEGGTQ